MSIVARSILVVELLQCATSQAAIASSSGTCQARDPSACTEAVSEADVATVDDAHAAAIRVSLMQKEHLHLQRSHQQKSNKKGSHARSVWHSDLVKCPGGSAVQKTETMTLADYDEVVEAMRGIYNSIDQTCKPDSCPQSAWSGCIVRFAAHDFLDYKEGLGGGSDACLAQSNLSSTTGLNDCWAGSEEVLGLVQVYEDFCTRMSLADFIVIAAEAVMNITRAEVLKIDPTRKPVDFRSQYMFGRVTAADCGPLSDNPPSFVYPEKPPYSQGGCAQVADTLITELGLTWDQSAALMGGHTLGGMDAERSGYTGRWTSFNSSRLFNNDYYVSMVTSGWGPMTKIEGQQYKNQWTRVDLGVDAGKRGLETMLDTDMCLYYSMFDKPVDESEDFAALNAVSAQVQNCACAWSSSVEYSQAIGKYNEGKFCGSTVMYPSHAGGSFDASQAHLGLPSEDTLNFTRQRLMCCGIRPKGEEILAIEPASDCGIPGKPLGHAAAAVKLFANSEETWIDSFLEAWGLATTKTDAQLYKLAD